MDVIFVGEISPKRKMYVDFLISNNIKIECFGPGWHNKPIYLKELVDKYRKSKIVLNFTRDLTGFSDRVLQVLGCKTLLITEYCRDLKKLFKKGFHLDWFHTPEELIELIKLYLEKEDLRNNIAEQGYNIATQCFKWDNVVERILKVINNFKE